MSNITEQEIEKLSGIMSMFGEAHTMLSKTKLSKEEYQPISSLLANAKVELFNFYKEHKAALQNKVSEEKQERWHSTDAFVAEDSLWEDLEDDFIDTTCPNCNREYDEIDREYQICHHCKFNNSTNL